MKRAALALACAIALGTPASVWALADPTQSERDHRIRFVDFDPIDVVQLDTVIGVATQITFAPGEQYVTHALGDSEAYELSSVQNHLFFKPVADQADTNLLVVTNLRNYAFRLSFRDSRAAKAVYRLEFRYPEQEAQARAEREREERRREALAKPVPVVNWRGYTMSGDIGLAPMAAWDDGRQTVLQFGPGQELPVAYLVGPDGQERLVNHHVGGPGLDLMVLHRVAERWHLRFGDRVLSIHNDGTPGDAPILIESASTEIGMPALDAALAHVPAEPAPPAAEAAPNPALAAVPHPEAPIPGQITMQNNIPAETVAMIEVTPPAAVAPKEPEAQAPTSDGRNLRYSVVGDIRLRPLYAWDDGERTWLQFANEPGAADQILIRAQDRSGDLHLVEIRRAGEHGSLAILDRVAPRWLLSRGDAFLVLQNDALVSQERP